MVPGSSDTSKLIFSPSTLPFSMRPSQVATWTFPASAKRPAVGWPASTSPPSRSWAGLHLASLGPRRYTTPGAESGQLVAARLRDPEPEGRGEQEGRRADRQRDA